MEFTELTAAALDMGWGNWLWGRTDRHQWHNRRRLVLGRRSGAHQKIHEAAHVSCHDPEHLGARR